MFERVVDEGINELLMCKGRGLLGQENRCIQKVPSLGGHLRPGARSGFKNAKPNIPARLGASEVEKGLSGVGKET